MKSNEGSEVQVRCSAVGGCSPAPIVEHWLECAQGGGQVPPLSEVGRRVLGGEVDVKSVRAQ